MRMLQDLDMRQKPLTNRRPYLFRATSDATWNSESGKERWEVKAKKIKIDGTLSTTELDKLAFGVEEDDVPVLEGDVCIEVVTDDGRRVLQPLGEGQQLDHSFLPKPNLDPENEDAWVSVTGGYVLFAGEWYFVDGFDIDNTTEDTHYWVYIDDDDPEDIEVDWDSGSAWPTTAGLKFVRLFEFGEIGKLSTVVRHTTNDIIWGEGVEHSFKPTQLTATTASIREGRVILKDGTMELVSVANITFSSDKCFWLKIVVGSTGYEINSTLGAGASFPAHYEKSGSTVTYNIPIVSFPDNTFTSCIRHQTNDIIMAHIADTDIGTKNSIERSPDDDTMQIRRVDTAGAWEAPYHKDSDITWQVPVKAPGTSPGALSGDVLTYLDSSGSEGTTVKLNFKKRSHEVADGAEEWGDEVEESISIDIDVDAESEGITWPAGTLYMVWQIKSGGVGWDWVRAH
jgi:hypothetical protein